MGTRDRTRPDESRKPSQITPEGYKTIEAEVEKLWAESRVMAEAVGVAAAEGDRSENAEYIYGKMKLGQIHRKLGFLNNRLDVLTVVRQPPPDDDTVHFGCWVEIENEDGEAHCYRIVGPDETDANRGWISVESPVAKALLGKSLDDEVHIRRPKGDLNAEIVAIHVRDPESP